MVGIGLLALHSNEARFGRADTRACYTYYYYKDNEEKFIQFCKDNHIEPFILQCHKAKANDADLATFDKTRVVFSSNMRLRKPQKISSTQFESYLRECLDENYPQLKYYEKIVEEINELIDKAKLKIKFYPRIKWSKSGKTVVKIGIRESSGLNNISKENRESKLKDYEFDMRYDVTSSIPRIVCSMNNGIWLSKDIDLYKEFYKIYATTDKVTSDEREAVKKLFMRVFFDNTPKNMVNHTWSKMQQDGISKKEVAEQMIKLRNAVEKVCGTNIRGTEAFLAESCIYLRVFNRLLSEGRKGWLLYDCFYCSSINGETKEAFTAKVERYIQESFNEYVSLSLENCI